MEDKIILKSNNLSNYVMLFLDKIENEFSREELNKINEITVDFQEEDKNIILDDLLFFENLNTLNIRNGYLNNDDFKYILKLNNLNNIYFQKCNFENDNLISTLNIKSLSLVNCNVNNYVFLNLLLKLEELTIINGTIDINIINKLSKLKYLQISYSKIIDNHKNIFLKDLKELYIDNTNITDLSFVKELSSLTRLSIDKKQFDINKDLINELIKNNIKIYNEDMIRFEGDNYEV